MTASSSPSPKLTKVNTSTASKVQTLNTRLAALVPTLTTTLSPSTVYQPGVDAVSGFPAEGNPSPEFSVVNQVGVWTAPQIGDSTAPYQVQVECFAGGGGGGGGSTAAGGGGGAGGEYACEPSYTVVPGKSYVWIAGGGGTPGAAVASGYAQPGSPGALTQFDVAGVNLPTGVIAHGGGGGDAAAVGIGGTGGTGSTNTLHYDGGAGGTNQSGVASDNPNSLTGISTLWTPMSDEIFTTAWYILDDNTQHVNWVSDASGNQLDATITSYSGGLGTGAPPGNITGAPVQVPTQTTPAGTWGTNPTIAGACVKFNIGSINSASAKIQCPGLSFSGKYVTVSGWTKCDPTGVFAQGGNGSFGTLIANCNYPNGHPGGYAVFWRNLGTGANPNWALNAYVSNGTTSYTAQYILGVANPANWIQFVMTYNNGTLSLYVDGALANAVTTTGYTTIPGGAYSSTMGVNPANTQNWYFGYLSNVWLVGTNAETLAGVEQAYGLTPAGGGGGGGGSGSGGGPGSIGGFPLGVSGGAGGAPTAVPSNLPTLTAGNTGAAGAQPGEGTTLAAPNYGAGGGAAGNSSPAPPSGGELIVPFTAAATYCGTDAGAAAGAIFNPNQQGTNGTLFSGGASTDIASGTKNSLLLIPPGTFTGFQYHGTPAQTKTATQILLTVFNANPSNPITSIIPVGYSYDTSLPANCTGSNIVQHVGHIAIPPGAASVTIDLTQSYFLQGVTGSSGGVPSAIVLGPGAAPVYSAYNAATGSAFYSQVYGPGAVSDGGNSLAPYLTVVYSNSGGSLVIVTLDVFLGTFGGQGQINLSTVDNESVPVATLQPYAVSDDGNGNSLAGGYTGPVIAFNPENTTPGSYSPEVWHKPASFGGTWSASGEGVSGFFWKMESAGHMFCQWDMTTTAGNGGTPVFTLPAAYRPAQSAVAVSQTNGSTTAAQLNVSALGVVQLQSAGVTGTLRYFGTAHIPLTSTTSAVSG